MSIEIKTRHVAPGHAMNDSVRIHHGHNDKLELFQQMFDNICSFFDKVLHQIFSNEGSSGLAGMLSGNHQDNIVTFLVLVDFDGGDDVVCYGEADVLDLYVTEYPD